MPDGSGFACGRGRIGIWDLGSLRPHFEQPSFGTLRLRAVGCHRGRVFSVQVVGAVLLIDQMRPSKRGGH